MTSVQNTFHTFSFSRSSFQKGINPEKKLFEYLTPKNKRCHRENEEAGAQSDVHQGPMKEFYVILAGNFFPTWGVGKKIENYDFSVF